MIELDEEFSPLAEAAFLKAEGAERRHKKLQIVMLAAVAIGIVGSYIGVGLHKHFESEEQAARNSAIYKAAARCEPSVNSEPITRTFTINKARLPAQPTDLDVAEYIARYVPGSEACDGDPIPGISKYTSLIALIDTENPGSDGYPGSLSESVASQTGGYALLYVPKSIDVKLSS